MTLRDKLKFWILLSNYVEMIVRGILLISLPDAIANSLKYVKAFGGTEQRNLPSGFTELQYIESTGTQYIDTRLTLAAQQTPFLIDVDLSFNDNTGRYLTGFSEASPGYAGRYSNGTFELNNKYTTMKSGINEIVNFQYGNISDLDNKIGIKITKNNETETISVNATNITRSNSTWCIFGNNSGSSVSFNLKGKVYAARAYKNNELKFNGIPAKNNDGVVGMYDMASEQFFTNAGTGEFGEGPEVVPTPDTPVDIVSNNGVLKASKNLFDINTITEDIRYNDSGEIVEDSNVWSSDYIPVLPGTAYTYSFTRETASNGVLRINFFDKQKNWLSVTKENFSAVFSVAFTETIPSNAYYIRTSQYKTVSNVQLELGSTATEYKPYGEIYTDGTVETIAIKDDQSAIVSTAVAEMLLNVGDYQDQQEIIDGTVTRKVGVKVLDGTESWGSYQSGACWAASSLLKDKVSGNYISFSTHYGWTSSDVSKIQNNQFLLHGTQRLCIKDDRFKTATGFKQYLAEQYAAGTPVIVVYPLATETTESVAGQTLQVTQGDNVLEITQASIDGLELEAKYNKTA